MDIEKLTKMQIVMLTLLVSFVTSIATGIVAVTLMDQAPPAITQTLNRVVERTVERVVPDESHTQTATVIEKETTVVVKEEDLITDSINKNSKNVVRIYEALEDGGKGDFSGLGVMVFRDGIIATDSSVIDDSLNYVIETADAKIFKTKITNTERGSNKFLLVEIPEGEEIIFPSAKLSNSNTFKLGQTVLSLTGEKRTDVAIGIISGLVEEEATVSPPADKEETAKEDNIDETEKEQETIKVLSLIKTSIDTKEVITGSPLIDIFGEVVGISTKDSITGKTALFTPVIDIKSAISEIMNSAKSTSNDETKIGE